MALDAKAQALALFIEGCRLLQLQQLDAAQDLFARAVDLHHGLGEAHGNLGYVLDRKGDSAQAEPHYWAALRCNPTLTQVYLNLGGLLTTQKRFTQAEACYAQALARTPPSAAVWSNLGVLYLAMQNEADAQTCLRQAMQLDPGYAKARFNLAYLELRHGRFAEGWELFEARDWYADLEKHFHFPRWQGEALRGRSILLCFEAGHGDVLQFCRYAALLRAMGCGRIGLVCHPALVALLQSMPALDSVQGFDNAIAADGYDYWTPLLSLPLRLGTRLETIPAELPYLHADPVRRARWAAPTDLPGLKVGLVWKGNPRFANDADRSLPHVRVLQRLWQVPGVRFFSLQKGAGESDVRELPADLPLVDLGSQLQDFADAAAVVAHMDLIISVDTAMAHLSGALGKACWVLLPRFMTDWRWGAEGSVAPWYPGCLRLFRQSTPGDWEPVLDALLGALQAWAQRPQRA